ncbi:MAG: threonylcarbamoyl-AMP synthase [Elusimicrobia bacterium]|nr:threonylcarbamoyl-AMP synthase [Elusimicrobiota bacterium]
MPVKTAVVRAGPDGSITAEELKAVAAAAKSCKIIAFPTDTVYGLGSTGLVKAASRRIYQIKQRSNLKPLPILVHSREAALRWVEMTPAAELLARKFWPGGLTLVLKPTQEGRLLTFPEYQTLAIRVPDHPLLLKLIEASGVPWVSTSANLSGSPSLKDGTEVARAFDGLVDFVVDAGPAGGLESSIADATGTPVRVLREGALSARQIQEALKAAV